MAQTERRLGEVKLQNVRLSFPHLWTPHASVPGGKEKFRASFLMDPNTPEGKRNIAACSKAQAEVEQEVFGRAGGIKYKDGRCCFRSGDDCTNASGDVYAGYEGMMVVSAANDRRVPVVDRNPSVPLTEADGRPYGGCYVNAIVRFYAIKDPKKGGAGLFATLEAVQFARDGEAFGAAPIDAASVFDNFEESDDSDDLGLDDDIPF